MASDPPIVVYSRLITNLPVLTEATFLLRFSVEAQRNLLLWAHQALDIDGATSTDLPRIADLLDKHRDMPADFAGASLVALAERLDLSSIRSSPVHGDRENSVQVNVPPRIASGARAQPKIGPNPRPRSKVTSADASRFLQANPQAIQTRPS